MASKTAHKRLTKEYVAMQREPPPFVWAAPDEKNILTWNFLIRGPPDSPFAGGEYHGILLFPSEYPFKPPGIKMLTPSGRFQPDRRICFSMSDFHPGSWNPAWSVQTILTGLLSFMLADEMTTGSVTSSDSHKRIFAQRSHGWNLLQNRFKEAFPEYCTPEMRDLPNMGERSLGKPDNTSPPATASTPPIPSTLTPAPAPVAHVAVHSTLSTASRDFHHKATDTASASGTSTPKKVNGHGNNNNHLKPTAPGTGWANTWRAMIWEKWRWGVLIALAVMVSRFSSSP